MDEKKIIHALAVGIGAAFVLLILWCGALAGVAFHYQADRDEWRQAAQNAQAQYEGLVAQIQAAQRGAGK